jgi:lipopolysaccharide transport system ATP-binding protein
MTENAIEVRGLGKKFYIGQAGKESDAMSMIADAIIGPFRRMASLLRNQLPEAADVEFWALRDVTFDVKQGEVLGIIGRNGSGKSTLLKTLTGISAPSEGMARIYGRVGSLLEVGTGFHPELTGRENIYMNGTLLGMKTADIRKHFDEIVDFSGVEQFIDTPTKRFSSGMQVRLAFSVAAHLDPEVLLVDEVLSVGDAEFRRKSMAKMQEITGQGRTVLLVSHNMASIQNLSSRVMLMDAGRMLMIDEPAKVVGEYLKRTHIAPSDASVDLTEHVGRSEAITPVLTRVRILDAAGNEDGTVPVGGTIKFEVSLDTGDGEIKNAWLVITVVDPNEVRVTTLRTLNQSLESLTLHGKQKYTCTWSDCNLAPGEYRLDIQVMSSMVKGKTVDSISRAVSFEVIPTDYFGIGRSIRKGSGLIWVKANWELDSTVITADLNEVSPESPA